MSTRREVQSHGRRRRPDGDGLVSADEDSGSAVGSGEAAGPAAVADGFRVRVSLERFFTDERARVLVWAERARSAGWLLRRLRASLPLPDTASLALVAGDCLLPPAEPLAVLRPDDLLQVIISSSERVPAAKETHNEVDVGDASDELEAVKRRALSMLDVVEANGELAVEPRRRRRVRRRRAAPPPAGGNDDDVDGAAPPTTQVQWRAELDAGAGVVRSVTPPRAARLVSAAH